MKKFLALLLVSLLALPALRAADFEGKVTMKLTGASDKPHEMLYSIKGTNTRVDVAAGQGGQVAMLMDSTKAEMTILMLDQHMFMTRPIPKADPAKSPTGDAAEATVEKTSVTEKILGYDCTKYISKSKNVTTEIWVTEQLGAFAGMGGGNPMGGGRGRGKAPSAEGQAWEKALAGMAVFPLRVVSTTGGKESFRMEATAIDKQSLPASTFTVPEGFQDLSGMMRGMGLPPGMKIPGGN